MLGGSVLLSLFSLLVRGDEGCGVGNEVLPMHSLMQVHSQLDTEVVDTTANATSDAHVAQMFSAPQESGKEPRVVVASKPTSRPTRESAPGDSSTWWLPRGPGNNNEDSISFPVVIPLIGLVMFLCLVALVAICANGNDDEPVEEKVLEKKKPTFFDCSPAHHQKGRRGERVGTASSVTTPRSSSSSFTPRADVLPQSLQHPPPQLTGFEPHWQSAAIHESDTRRLVSAPNTFLEETIVRDPPTVTSRVSPFSSAPDNEQDQPFRLPVGGSMPAGIYASPGSDENAVTAAEVRRQRHVADLQAQRVRMEERLASTNLPFPISNETEPRSPTI